MKTKPKSLALGHTEMAQESTGGKQETHIFCCFLNEAMYDVPLDFATWMSSFVQDYCVFINHTAVPIKSTDYKKTIRSCHFLYQTMIDMHF